MSYQKTHLYTIHISGGYDGSAFNPADSSNYYFGSINWHGDASSNGKCRTYIPKSGKITNVVLNVYASTPGTNEDITANIRVNDTTDHLLGVFQTDASIQTLNVSGLNISVAKDDYIVLKLTTPAWTNNPFGVMIGGEIIIAGV